MKSIANDEFLVIYDKQHHAAIKMVQHFESGEKTTGMLFKSGSIIFAGLKTPSNMFGNAFKLLEKIKNVPDSDLIQNVEPTEEVLVDFDMFSKLLYTRQTE